MAVIKVNLQSLEDVAKEVEQYVSLIRCNNNLSQQEVDNLLSRWNGPDASAFAKKGSDSLTENESTVNCLIESLESFHKYLRYCKVQYEHEQTEAITRSGGLYVL